MPNFKEVLEQATHEATAFTQSVQSAKWEQTTSRFPEVIQWAGKITLPLAISLSVLLDPNDPDFMTGRW